MNTTEELKLDETEELNNSSFNCSKVSMIKIINFFFIFLKKKY